MVSRCRRTTNPSLDEEGGPAARVPEKRRPRQSPLIERTVDQLKGNVRFDWGPKGLICQITIRA